MSQDWKNLIPGAMAGDTAPFGLHPNDEKRAKEAISQAKEANATFEDFECEIVSYSWRRGIRNIDKIEAQVERARKFWK